MRKILILTTAVLALAACSKNNIDTAALEGREIAFTAVAGKATKALITGTTYGTGAPNFGIFAYALPSGTAWASNDQDRAAYMDNVEIKYDDASGVKIWKPDAAYYWPLSGSLTFIGYSPYMASGVTYAPATKTLTFENFTQDQSVDSQKDLMWATTAADKQSNEGTYAPGGNVNSGVNIVFHHALSQVKFYVKKATGLDDYTIKVKSITFDAYSKGTFTISNDAIDNTTAGDVTYNTNWTSQAKQEGFIFTAYTDDGEEDDDDEIAPSNNSDFALVGTTANMPVPQQLDNGTQTFSITYSLNKGDIDLGEKTVANINFLGGDVKAWLPNTIYNYNIVIDLNKIYFNPTISDWDNNTPPSQGVDVK